MPFQVFLIILLECFRDYMKHVAMQCCHIALWHNGKAGMLFRMTPCGQHSSTPCFSVGYWSPMDCTWVSSLSLRMSQNCAPHSAQHSGLPQTCSILDTPMKFPTTMQSHRPCWTGTKGKVTPFLDKSLLWTKSGLAHTNQTWNTYQNGNIPVQRKCTYTIWCEGDFHCGIWHWWDNTAPRSTSKADKRCLLLDVPAAPL